MNLYLFHPDQFQLHYNCTVMGIGNEPIEKRRNLVVGILFVVTSITAIVSFLRFTIYLVFIFLKNLMFFITYFSVSTYRAYML